ncbi:nuclear transport factor 2 family protein [Flavihumibacter sp. RY-1]|uniref:Nuclear transport factor 2 family protein n=1 Tax=Flavihumibacter fluminis TaxID=2909236 RepID=A0ABS9BEW0_9BACT|nr:nuclear transport factor 2 family protein [Flavihumibacter fluminis]MCF1714137.1 nuclear transport factor 2 family protein [Flavihumibacter fluminis]
MVRAFMLYIFLLLATTGNAQSKEEVAVAAQLDRLNKAMVDKNLAVLEDIFHANMWYGHSSGRLDDKLATIKDVMEGPVDFITLEATDRKIQLVEKNAMIRFIFEAKATNNGQEQTIRIGVMTVWKKEKSGWKLFARQAYKL